MKEIGFKAKNNKQKKFEQNVFPVKMTKRQIQLLLHSHDRLLYLFFSVIWLIL